MDNQIESKISAILLAAGLSRRMGGKNKLLLPYRGKPLLHWAVELLESFHFYEKIIVTTPGGLSHVALPYPVKVALNSYPEEGLSRSVRLGVSAAAGEHYLFLMADQPRLTPSVLRQILNKARGNTDKIIFPSINGKPSTPALFPERFRDELLKATAGFGGRAVRAAHPEACLTWEAESPEELMDIDTEEDYKALVVSTENQR